MISSIIKFFFGTKEDKIRKQIDEKRLVALKLQRNGNIKEYSRKKQIFIFHIRTF